MKFIYHPIFKEHDTGMHPENKKRLEALGEITIADIPFDESLISLIHGTDYIEQVKKYCETGMPLDGDTRTSIKTYEAAVFAANATLMASHSGDMAIVRPPGHHAHRNHASGFCIFNNVAVAAQYHANQGKHVLIFDFDGHLGDGTTDIFYDTDKVMYWSIHQYPGFPNRGLPNEIGRGKGKGYNINVPLPPGSGDDIFMDAFETILPVALQFKPDIVALSAGFDAHQYDLLLELKLTVDTFYRIGETIKSKFDHIFATLEGGYNIEELSKCVHNFVDGINGDPKKHTERTTETDIKIWNEYEMNLHQLMGALQPYWNF